ncbi:MAG: MAPEG family protein [Pseudomonadota bacterium]
MSGPIYVSVELFALYGSILILLVLVTLQAVSNVMQRGLAWGLSNRDETEPAGQFAARVKRTLDNHVESLLLFGFAVLTAEAIGAMTALTGLGAMLYFWGRLIYAPVYVIGIPYVRTLVWAVGMTGIVLVLFEIGRLVLAAQGQA